MKKIFALLTAGLFTVFILSACGTDMESKNSGIDGNNSGDSQINEILETSGKLQVVTTLFPQYDWVKEILGEETSHVELTLLLNNGVDLHSYQPTVDDIIKISTCDLFIYTGGESDKWVEDVLFNANNPHMVIINLLDILGDDVKAEEIIEGMEHDGDHEHEADTANISDRPLSDFAGDWVTIENTLDSGGLDEYISQQAVTNGIDFEEQKRFFGQQWKSDYETLSISESAIAFGNLSSDYGSIGYKIVERDHGFAVWYGFEALSPQPGVPSYIAFSDHAAASGAGREDEHTENHKTGHYHMRYGNDSFEALTAIEDWSPAYFPAGARDGEIVEAISGHSHEYELDEHVWLSLRHSATLCHYISERLIEIDPERREVYMANTAAYKEKLDTLDQKYIEVVHSSPRDTLLFADRFPFRYLVDDYGLSYFAAFSGCSAETEASFETIVFLADKARELDLKNVMVIETSNQALAKTVIQNSSGSNGKILVLDSIQSVTASDIASGISYLSIMEKNLEVLKTALN